ncbi:aminodeoxychorismate lyase [Vibrio atypicus]|uniref:aminodeoxychorismate lyase n=1 Tax=Vibrio atypicus TaxID=558271 RepID=UPI003736A72F
MYLFNGERASTVSIADRSFQYGDGCFTTMLTHNGEIQHWLKHKARMDACLDALMIAKPDWLVIESWLAEMAYSDPKAGLKLHISRGEGGRGYSPTQVPSPNVTISAFHFPAHYEQWSRDGIELGVCSKRLGINPLLAGHKHNNRLEQVLLKADIEQQGFDDGVALDCNGHVVETTMANLFWRKGDTLFTPDLGVAGVAGVMRRVVIERLENLSLNLAQGDFELDALLAADEVFITNSILEVAPVTAIGEQTFSIGNITKKIQENPLP